MKRILAFLLFMASPAMASFSGYAYKRQIIIPAQTSNSGSLTNIPIPINFTDITLSTSVSGGHLSTGYDISIASDSNCQFIVAHDTEALNTNGSQPYISWFSAPLISSSSTQTVWLCYGNPAITSYVGYSSATWDSGFGNVMHVPNGSSLLLKDVTFNNTTPTNIGATATSGVIDGGAATGASSFTNTGYRWQNITSSITISLWFKTSTPGATQVMYSNYAGATANLQIFMDTGNKINFEMNQGVGGNAQAKSNISCDDGAWHYAVGTYGTSANIPTLTIDGTLKTTAPFPSTPNANFDTGNAFMFGASPLSGGIAPFTGSLDELEISQVTRSSDWIQTSYVSEVPGNTFLTIGPEQGGPPPSSIRIIGNSKYRGKMTIL